MEKNEKGPNFFAFRKWVKLLSQLSATCGKYFFTLQTSERAQ